MRRLLRKLVEPIVILGIHLYDRGPSPDSNFHSPGFLEDYCAGDLVLRQDLHKQQLAFTRP